MKTNIQLLTFAIALCSALWITKSCRPEPDELYPNLVEADTATVDTISAEPQIPPYDTCYENAIAHLKEYEGFREKPYKDMDGSWTIGYGHHMIDGYWKWNETMSEYSADTLLRSDLNKRIENVLRMYDLQGYRALAIALFIYNCGSTAYDGSTLRKLVDEGKPIDEEIVKWCHYTNKGVTFTNERMKERREFELKIYNYGMVDIR